MKNELIKGERINDKSQETDLIELTSKIWMNKERRYYNDNHFSHNWSDNCPSFTK